MNTVRLEPIVRMPRASRVRARDLQHGRAAANAGSLWHTPYIPESVLWVNHNKTLHGMRAQDQRSGLRRRRYRARWRCAL